MTEKKKLESIIEKVNNQSIQKDTLLREKDEKIEDMKTIVGRLTGTNNEMLAILSTKVRLEESVKSLESANRKLMQVTIIPSLNESISLIVHCYSICLLNSLYF